MERIKTDQEIIDYFSDLILDELKEFNCWVAGGAVLSYIDNRPINDFDIYFTNKEDRRKCFDYLKAKEGIVTVNNDIIIRMLYNNKTLELTTNYYESPQHCVDDYDYSVCGIGVDCEKVYKVDNFYDGWRNKLLVLNNIQNPVKNLIRMQKYLRRGYRMTETETMRLVNSIQQQ